MSNGQKKPHLKGQGKWLKEVRGDRNIKQMSEIFGISERAWRHYENEERKVSSPIKKLIEIDQWSKVADKNEKYDLHGRWTGRSINDFCGVDHPEFKKAVDLLADIFRGDNRNKIKLTIKFLNQILQSEYDADIAQVLMIDVLNTAGLNITDNQQTAILKICKKEIEKAKNDIADLILAFKSTDT